MKTLSKIIILIVLGLNALILASCTTTQGLVQVERRDLGSPSISFVKDVSQHHRNLIVKAINNAAPGHVQNITVRFFDIDSIHSFGINVYTNPVQIWIPRNIHTYSDAQIVFAIGHELGHTDPDVRRLSPHAEEFTCDQWGIITALELGYDGYDAAGFFDKRNHGASDTHPASSVRKQKVLDTVKMRGNR